MWSTILASKVYGSIGFRCELQGKTTPKFKYRKERVVLVCGKRRWTVKEIRTPFQVWATTFPDEDGMLELYQDIAYGVSQYVTVAGQTIEIQSLNR